METTTKASTRSLDPIPLFNIQPPSDPEVTPGKLKLNLRTTELEVEFKGIPRSILKLHHCILQCRQQQFEIVYRGILAYLKILREDPNFYRRLECSSLDDYHIKYGLGSGQSLAKMIALVRLFERETFVLVGDLLLNQMLLKLVAVQSSAATRKRDIRQIFERYCENYERFDRDTFRQVIGQYINDQYPPPKEKPQPTPKEELVAILTRKGRTCEIQPKVELRTSRTSKVLEADDTADQYRLKERQCSGCNWRDEAIQKGYETYIFRLRSLIRQLKGTAMMDEIEVPTEITAYRRRFNLKAR